MEPDIAFHIVISLINNAFYIVKCVSILINLLLNIT